MEPEILKWLVTSALGVLVWFMKRTLDQVEKTQKEHSDELTRIKDNYLHKSDFKEFKVELRSMFEEIRQDIRELKK